MTTQNRIIKVIGVGSAGKNILQRLQERALPGLTLALVNPEPLPGAESFLMDTKSLRELDLAKPEEAEALLAPKAAAIKAWCAGADMVFVVTGLGGKTGSGLGPAIAKLAKEAGALVLGFASMPFECEGSRRVKQAQQSLEQLRIAGDGVVCLPNEKILKLHGEEVGLREVFSLSDGLLADGLTGVWRLLNCRGLIEIHFDELREVLRANRMESFFAAAEASGPGRARETVEQLLASPLLADDALGSAGTIIVSLVAGDQLTMAEVNRVMEQINRHADGAQVIMGAALHEAFGDKLSVTVIATRRERLAERGAESHVTAELMNPEVLVRPASRFVPPPSAVPEVKLEDLAPGRKAGARARKGGPKMRQEQLPLEIINKGRFDKSEPTIFQGEDLDEPTYIRRGLVFN